MSEISAPDPRWYLVQTKCRAERRTALRLGWAGYATTLPLVAEPRRDRLRRHIIHTAQVPCFPGYVFVQLDLARESLHPVVHCEGVKRLFMGGEGQPLPIKRGLTERLMEEADARRDAARCPESNRALAALAEGSRMRLTAGPFEDREGVCLWSSGDRIGLLMEILGGMHEIVVARSAAQAA